MNTIRRIFANAEYILLIPAFFASMLRGEYLQEAFGSILVRLPGQIEVCRQHALSIIAISLTCATAVAVMKAPHKLRRSAVPPALIALFFLHIAVSYRERVSSTGEFGSFVVSVGAECVIITLLGVLLPRSPDNLIRVCWALQASVFIFVVASTYAWFVAPDVVYWKGRLNGVSSHPVFTGIIGAVGVCSAFIIFNYHRSHILRSFAAFSAVLCTVVVGLSGTRLAATMVGAFLVVEAIAKPRIMGFYAAVLAVSVPLFFATALWLMPEIPSDEFRIQSMENTRAEVWREMWRLFINNPYAGTSDIYTPSENSYLLAGVRVGVVGVVLSVAIGIFALKSSVAVLRRTKALSESRLGAADCSAAAAVLGFFALSVFEGYWSRTVCFHTLVFVALVGIVESRAKEPVTSSGSGAGLRLRRPRSG